MSIAIIGSGGAEDHHVVCGSLADAGKCKIVCITAGAKQREGETHIAPLSRNLAILESILTSMQPIDQNCVLIIIANPCDVLTHFARYSFWLLRFPESLAVCLRTRSLDRVLSLTLSV
jgi:malate/lactate dehydrogenase